MTGPEHYREAERLLGWWTEFTPAERKTIRRNARWHGATPLAEGLAAAQVHATLALASATATEFSLDLAPSNDIRRLWLEVTQ